MDNLDVDYDALSKVMNKTAINLLWHRCDGRTYKELAKKHNRSVSVIRRRINKNLRAIYKVRHLITHPELIKYLNGKNSVFRRVDDLADQKRKYKLLPDSGYKLLRPVHCTWMSIRRHNAGDDMGKDKYGRPFRIGSWDDLS